MLNKFQKAYGKQSFGGDKKEEQTVSELDAVEQLQSLPYNNINKIKKNKTKNNKSDGVSKEMFEISLITIIIVMTRKKD